MSEVSTTIIGQPSAGSTGQPLILELGSGAWAAITSRRDLLPAGSVIVGTGILPDIEAPPSIQSIREGRDLALEKAVEILSKN